MRPLPFIILADLRTGSTLLAATLDTHSEANCLGELFHPRDLPDNSPPGVNRYGYSGRELIGQVFGRRGVKAAGFKAMVFLPTTDQPQWSDAWDALETESNLHVIVLRRGNFLAQYVSYLIACRTGKFHPSPGDPILASESRPRLHVDPRDFIAWRNERQRLFRRRLAPLLSKPTLEIEYAELVRDWRRQITRVQQFLRLPPQPLKPEKSRQEQRALHQVVENYDQLVSLDLVDYTGAFRQKGRNDS